MKMLGYDFRITRDARAHAPYKVGLALSGGGARGFAHAGAIDAMSEVGLTAGIIAGVSAGSVVAVMHAAGIPGNEMTDMFSSLKFNDLASLQVPRDGFCSLERFKQFLKKNIPFERLEDLPVRTLVCATDFDTGRKTIFDQGPIADCVAASCCIPIVFKPVVIGGKRYVDGGVLANLPAWAVRDKCRFLVGVNCSPVTHGPVGENIIAVALRSYELLAKNNATHDMNLCDMLINTDDIAQHKVFDLKGIRHIYESGYRTALNFFEQKGILPKASQNPSKYPA